MKTRIQGVISRLQSDLEQFFDGTDTDVDSAERFFADKISAAITELMGAYYEKLDAELLADKAGRKKAGLVVERRNCPRQLLMKFGMMEYHRTYYKKTADGTYAYPIDALAGVEAYQRLSGGVSQSLVEVAAEMSYAKSSSVVTNGRVSRRTVGNKVRQSVPVVPIVQRRSVPVLHVDADEDHVKLQSGRGTIIPLASIYETTDRIGRRGVCKNCWHRATYGQKPDEFWEDTLNEIERRYDLTNTKIYLHGDGAAWIKKGLEWLPNSVFVLDRFHKNKALKAAVSGIEQKVGKQFERVLRHALNDDDIDLFLQATDSLIDQYPDRIDTIRQNTNYLLENYDAIRICKTDPESLRGGSTEPHVSHVLSARLSSRPMAWSKATLKRFVPILAAGHCRIEKQHPIKMLDIARKIEAKEKRKKAKYTLGLVDPDRVVNLPGKSGQVTPLFNALRWI